MSLLLKNLLSTLSKGQKPTSKSKRAKKLIQKPPKPLKKKAPKKPSKATESAAREIINFAREEADKIRKTAQVEVTALRQSLVSMQQKLQSEQGEIISKQRYLDQEKNSITNQKQLVEKLKDEVDGIKKKQLEKLEKIAKLSKEEAKDILLSSLDKHLTQDIAERIEEAKEKIQEVADEKAREILVDSMYHGATDYVAEFTVSTLKLPDDEVKGRIIGKDGRNIRAFEKTTGVDLDMDETPGEVRLSCFDPVRREIARVALARLIKDGRIQPTRIEEYVAKAKREIDKVVFEEGKKLCHAVKAYNVPRDLMALLGRFKYRTSYGQNMISHTLEETKIGMKLAEEIGANVEIVKMGCLLHDIGKILNEEGSHVEVGVKLLKKFNVPKSIIDTVAQHHEDEEYTSIESTLVYIADAISGARPGARYENYEEYITRLNQLEEIATSKKGVKEAYAIQAGREVRVIIDPEKLSDDAIVKLAHDIKEEIKTTMTYPGTVTVNVIRETRASSIAK